MTGTLKRGPIPLKEGGLLYWEISVPLAYQRNFNFINGERSIGKTYTTLKYFIRRFISHKDEFIYITRTQMEKKNGILQAAFAKVVAQEYSEYDFSFNNETMKMENEVIGYCVALTEADKIKKRSFPFVRWMVFDEYMIDEKAGGRYVNGWNEPDSLLSIYHTADRERDVIKCFLLGNNITFFNPYHLHPAFNIPQIERGGIWTSENVLFQWAVASEEMKEEKSKSKFLRMIENTNYGVYASQGQYIYDDYSLIVGRSKDSKYVMTLHDNGTKLGVWHDRATNQICISPKFDPSCKTRVALEITDIAQDVVSCTISYHFKWLAELFKKGYVGFETMEFKSSHPTLIKRLTGRY